MYQLKHPETEKYDDYNIKIGDDYFKIYFHKNKLTYLDKSLVKLNEYGTIETNINKICYRKLFTNNHHT